MIAARVLTAAAAGTRPRHARQRLDPGLDALALAEERRPQVIDLLAPDDEDAPRPSVGGEVPADRHRVRGGGLEHPADEDEVPHMTQIVDVDGGDLELHGEDRHHRRR